MERLLFNIECIFQILKDNKHEKLNVLRDSKEDLENNGNIKKILEICKDESIREINKILVDETIELLNKQFSANVIKHTCEKIDIKNIPDDVFELSLKIINNPRYRFELYEENEKVCFSSNMANVCRNGWDVKRILKSLEVDDRQILLNKNGVFSFKNLLIPGVNQCNGCNHSACPKLVLCALSYYKNNGKLEEIIESRRRGIGFFDYMWEPEDGLREIPENIYQMALKIVDNNQIGLSRKLDNNLIRIFAAYTCGNFREVMTVDDLNKLKAFKYGQWKDMTRNPEKKLLDGLCKGLGCRKEACPFVVAAYIYYLRMTNQEDLITTDRMYYSENEDEILKIAKENYNKKLEELNNSGKKKEIRDAFEQYKLTTSNIDLLVDSLSSNVQKNLYCIVEKEPGVRNNLINEIANALRKENKIIKKDLGEGKFENDYKEMSLSSFASKLVVPISTSVVSYGDYRENKISENVLYILDDITEFMNMYRSFDKTSGAQQYSSIRKKQIASLIDILCGMGTNRYIIIQGSKQEIDSFLTLDSRLKYIYSNFRLEIKSLSVDELFEIYKKKLESEVFDVFLKDPDAAKNKFIEYVSNNRMLVPFKNEELAIYLATYSNSKGDISFPPDAYKKQSLEESLADIVGLDSIKKKVKEFEQFTVFYNKARALDLKIPNNNMHMIFTGNPGCGKTTIARIMAKMLFDIGLISENKLVEVERKDLVAQYIGQTAIKTAEVIDRAMGGVLFVDEAYSLTPNDNAKDFGQEAIATLIKAMEDHKDNLVVIFAGYKDEMKRFVDSNPGISSRIGYKFDFPDYSADELTEIFKRKLKKSGFRIDKNVLTEVNMLCSYFVKKKAFGNGRFIGRMVQETLVKHAKNNPDDMLLITKEDLPTLEDLTHEHTTRGVSRVALEDVIGLETLKERVMEFEDYVIFANKAKKMGLKIPNNNMHMLFRGNPGTGKTTIARIVSRMLFDMGVLHENKLVEVERKDLVAEYLGQTAAKTAEVIDRAMGGVLFIDEAYSLTPNGNPRDYGHEAITALIKAMEDHKGEFVVIFAGYKDEMSDFVSVNPGIASRLGYVFDFEDYGPEELKQIFDLKMKKAGFVIADGVHDKVMEVMKYFYRVKDFGNGRFVDKFIQEILINHAKNKNENIEIISEEDIPDVKEMISCVFSNRNMITPDTISEKSLRKTAIHEIGHAFVRYKLKDTPNIRKITINVDGRGALGYVEMNADTKATRSRSEFMDEIKVLVAGMASESVFNGEFENGNGSDLEKATNIARRMIIWHGMSDLGLGQITDTSGEMAVLIQHEVNKIIKECYDESRKIISENKEQMEKLIQYLLEHKELTGEQFLSEL